MGIVCGFYRMDDAVIDQLIEHPEDAQNFITDNYSSVTGKYHIENDTVFETDKAWDIAKFLLKESDPSTNKILNNLDGEKIDQSCKYLDCLRYIKSGKVKAIYSTLAAILSEKIIEVYDKDKMIQNHVYRADWWDEPDWDYILSHIQTMIKAFEKAAECDSGIVINFH